MHDATLSKVVICSQERLTNTEKLNQCAAAHEGTHLTATRYDAVRYNCRLSTRVNTMQASLRPMTIARRLPSFAHDAPRWRSQLCNCNTDVDTCANETKCHGFITSGQTRVLVNDGTPQSLVVMRLHDCILRTLPSQACELLPLNVVCETFCN